MGNRHLLEMERLHTLATPESGVLKVTALPSPERFAQAGLNLFHPTAFPPFQKIGLYFTTQLHGEEGQGGDTF